MVIAMSKQVPPDNALRDKLRAAGLRATGARLAVLRQVMRARTPLSHAEVCERVAETGMDRATVYRNLMDLADAGLVTRTDIDHVWRFEWLAGEQPAHAANAHPHFVCSDCGTVACLPTSAVSLHAVRGAPRALQKSAVEVRVRGLCDACV
jgi:Fur family ferric uptake transcriptional regulator